MFCFMQMYAFSVGNQLTTQNNDKDCQKPSQVQHLAFQKYAQIITYGKLKLNRKQMDTLTAKFSITSVLIKDHSLAPSLQKQLCNCVQPHRGKIKAHKTPPCAVSRK